jgi:hypothetical protein
MSSPRPLTQRHWLLAGGLLAALASTGCGRKSFPLDAGGGDDGGDSSVCSCAAPGGSGVMAVACGKSTCANGTFYLCSDESLLIVGACGEPLDAGGGGDGGPGCVPACSGSSCSAPNGCGGTCLCAPGLPCDPATGACGNGCQIVQAGIPCRPGADASSDPQDCCSDGYRCVTDDAGYAGCCAATSAGDAGRGVCQSDQDCCDYPVVHCQADSRCQ